MAWYEFVDFLFLLGFSLLAYVRSLGGYLILIDAFEPLRIARGIPLEPMGPDALVDAAKNIAISVAADAEAATTGSQVDV